MSDNAALIERIKSALENPGDSPWLPDLTSDLVEVGWRTLHQETGLSPANYGTSRVIAKSAHAPREVVAYLSSAWAVEVFDERLAGHYEAAGIEFYTAKEITGANLLSCVEEAINLIKRVPTLYATVAALVKALHLIKPADDDYDVSFSEPHIPFSIFVSVPQQQSATTALRIAEAVVHEALHLQLTLVESILPLVRSSDGKYYSPWRREYRDAKGLLHALYVFRVINRFLEELSSSGRCITASYAGIRRWEIAEEINLTLSFRDCSELTPVGSGFVRSLM
jgi:HEXXH motif-containing protein